MQGRANCQAPGTGAGLWVMGYGLWEIGVEIVWVMGNGNGSRNKEYPQSQEMAV